MAEPKHIIEAAEHIDYDADFAHWADQQSRHLAAGRFDQLDVGNLIDEVSALAKRDFRSLIGAIRVVLIHMLKWDYQPEERSQSWRRSIHNGRSKAELIIDDSPSFANRTDEVVARAYPAARSRAALETTIPERSFPSKCPYDWNAIMTRAQEFQHDG